MVIEAADNITLKTGEFVVEADSTRINSEVVINLIIKPDERLPVTVFWNVKTAIHTTPGSIRIQTDTALNQVFTHAKTCGGASLRFFIGFRTPVSEKLNDR